MIQQFHTWKKFLETSFKQESLRRKVLYLSLSGILLTFLAMCLTLPSAMFLIHKLIAERSNEWGKNIANLTEKFSSVQTEHHLREIVATQSQLIESNLEEIQEDVLDIAAGMEHILANQNNYAPRYLPSSRQGTLPTGVAYVHYSKRMLGNMPHDVQEELYRVSNIEDIMIAVMNKKEYEGKTADVTISSEKGYTITMDYSSTSSTITLPEDFLDKLDPQQYSTWYRAVKTTGKIFFTEPHFGLQNNYIHCGAPYFVDGEFAGGVAIATDVTNMYQQIINTDLMKTDINIIVNRDGKIILSSKEAGYFVAGDRDYRLYPKKEIADVIKRMTAKENGVAVITVDDVKYYIAFAPIELADWSFATIIKQSTIDDAAIRARKKLSEEISEFGKDIDKIFLFLMTGSLIVIVGLLIFVLRRGIHESENFLKPIQTLIAGVQDIAKGNFDRRLEVKTQDEIGSLAQAVNLMASELKTYISDLTEATKERERISTELNVAANIQQSALPHDFDFNRTDFEIYATMHAAKEVGGDFYDFYLLDENHLAITIADVSGKGVPAALFMMQSKTILKNLATMMKTPDEFATVMTLANQQLCHNNDEMLFVTVFMGMLDLTTGEFIYVNAGHDAPLICRENKFEFLDVGKSCMLGIDEDMTFAQKKISLKLGDMIFLYTDGVTEAMNERREQFLRENLQDTLNREDKSESIETLLENMRKAIKAHAGNAEQYDDITMLALRWTA